MASVFDRIRAGLAKTAQQIRQRLGAETAATTSASSSSAASKGALSIDTLEAVEDALLAADVGLPATRRIIEAVKADTQGRLGERVARVVLGILRDVKTAPAIATLPHVILVVGVNGTGKTTTVGKLANLYRGQGRSVLVCAADTFRAAAVEQLAVWAERAGVDLVKGPEGSDPGAVAFDAIARGRERGADVIIVDTAGRLHTQHNLMEELTKVRRVIAKQMPDAPHETLMTVDATTGQNGVRQAKLFGEAVGVTGIVLTKLDGTAKGGIALAIANELGIPVKLIGIGEQLEDLRPFDADEFARALLT